MMIFSLINEAADLMAQRNATLAAMFRKASPARRVDLARAFLAGCPEDDRAGWLILRTALTLKDAAAS